MVSSIQDEPDPNNLALRRGISSFDIKHNFIISYRYEVPLDQLLRKGNRVPQGWALTKRDYSRKQRLAHNIL